MQPQIAQGNAHWATQLVSKSFPVWCSLFIPHPIAFMLFAVTCFSTEWEFLCVLFPPNVGGGCCVCRSNMIRWQLNTCKTSTLQITSSVFITGLVWLIATASTIVNHDGKILISIWEYPSISLGGPCCHCCNLTPVTVMQVTCQQLYQ